MGGGGNPHLLLLLKNYKRGENMKLKLFLLLGIILTLSVVFNPVFCTKAEERKDLDIDTFPNKRFLEMDMLKPGDKIISSLDVINKGNILFTYKTNAEFSGGSKKYFNALLINVKDGKKHVLYNGKLKDFKGLDPRKLLILTKDKFFFTIEVPNELGNEYQGLSTNVKLTFFAEDSLSNTNILPNTATNNINLIFSGLTLCIVGVLLYFFKRKKKLNEK
jgi:LPXTG-motif cell wall-anchored protein